MKRFARRLISLTAAVMTLLVVACADIYIDQAPPASWSPWDVLKLTTFPTANNDSALLEVGGLSMLIDGGFKGYAQDMTRALRGLGYDGFVDVLYNTHPHDDHIGAVAQMLRTGFRASLFVSTFPKEYDEPGQTLAVAELDAAGIPYLQLGNCQAMDFGGAHIVFYYFPDGRDPNALSSIAHITFGNATILLTADASTAAQSYFHEELGPMLQADIMKFPHHAHTVMRRELLEDVKPGFVYVTNRRNSTPKANEQLRARGIPFKHTSMGPIVMVTNGEDWYITQTNNPF